MTLRSKWMHFWIIMQGIFVLTPDTLHAYNSPSSEGEQQKQDLF
jgi:hypothetical protein